MAEVRVHEDGDVVLAEDVRDGAVLVEPHDLLAEVQRPAEDKALRGAEPSAVVQVPERPGDVQGVQVAGLEEPQDAGRCVALQETSPASSGHGTRTEGSVTL